MKKLLSLLMSLVALLACNMGKGQYAPSYQQDPAAEALGTTLNSTLQGLLNTPYSSLVSQFTPSGSATGLMDTATKDYTNLINNANYSTTDNTATEKNYLDSILNEYNTSRTQQKAQLDQSLAANNLVGSGPGYQQQEIFNNDTATGVGNLTSQWAEQGITNQQQQQAYKDALQRGDYATLYSLGQSNANASLQPQLDAQTALDNYISMGSGTFSELTNANLNQYNAALQKYQLDQQNTQNLGGLGTGVGALLGGLLAAPTGGLSIGMGALLGAGAGGGVGSMIQI